MYPEVTEPTLTLSRKQKIIKWLKKHWATISIVAGAILITGAFVFAIFSVKQDNSSVTITNKPRPAEKFYSLLTGVEVGDESALKQPVTAVMIENSPDARPQSGLKQAGVVYEAVAEGGITRFAAIYQHDKPELIGPVRSLRIHYLGWIAPYQASIAHVGGSHNALTEVRNGSHRDIDQFFNPDAYWRATDRYAPHNMYTNFEKLDALNSSKGYNQSEFTSFKRADGKPSAETNAISVTINFSSDNYNTSYAYNPETNTYLRHIAGTPHEDREHGQIAPSVVVAIKVNAQSRGGADGYEDIVTDGSGQAYIFQNGTVQEAIWQKSGLNSPLELVDPEGNAISLNRGQTWIGAITSRGSVSWQ